MGMMRYCDHVERGIETAGGLVALAGGVVLFAFFLVLGPFLALLSILTGRPNPRRRR